MTYLILFVKTVSRGDVYFGRYGVDTTQTNVLLEGKDLYLPK